METPGAMGGVGEAARTETPSLSETESSAEAGPGAFGEALSQIKAILDWIDLKTEEKTDSGGIDTRARGMQEATRPDWKGLQSDVNRNIHLLLGLFQDNAPFPSPTDMGRWLADLELSSVPGDDSTILHIKRLFNMLVLVFAPLLPPLKTTRFKPPLKEKKMYDELMNRTEDKKAPSADNA